MNNCPAFEKGRWYSFFIESDGSKYKITNADNDVASSKMSGTHLQLPQDFIVVDYQFIMDNSPINSATGINKELYKYANGTHGVTLPAVSEFTNCKVYVFGYFDR